MESREFVEHIRGIRETASVVDAALQDLRGAAKNNRPTSLHRAFHQEAKKKLEEQLDEVLQHPKGLRPEQLTALGTVVFATPAHSHPQDYQVDKFQVMESMTGAMKGIGEMPRGKEKMLLTLEGRGKAMIQGTTSEYKPVMIDRSEL